MTLKVEDLTVCIGDRRLVGPLGVSVARGEPLTILGETGAGKSLLAQAIMGALPRGLNATGAVLLDGQRLDSLPERARQALWGRRLAMLPQEPWRALDPLMAAGSQVAEVHALIGRTPWQKARSLAEQTLTRLKLDRRAGAALPGTLSGGMAQRVAFAAATAGGAGVLLADEPTKGLDEMRRDEVVRLLADFVAEGGILITITHDIAVARALGGQAMILREGEVVESGVAERVLSAPQSAYGRELVAADPATWPLPESRPATGDSVLRAEALSVARGQRLLCAGIGFDLPAGGRLAITGPSGLGKTSLLDTLAGLIPPSAGRVERLGRARAPVGLQKLYQDPPAAFAPQVSLATSLDDLERRHGLPPDRLPSLLQRLGLAPDLLARRPRAVSGGELQRLALARVLALAPAVILADEPTSRLDPVTQRRVMAVIAEAAEEAEAAVILVTHHATMARHWALEVLDLERNAEVQTAA
ncbi:MAG: ATP-binding cassette domain-containing protein [Kiloniellaceae bacterium]